MTDPDKTTEVMGGEIWHQPDFPCFTVYIITGLEPYPRFMGYSSDPRERGHVMHSSPDGRVGYIPEELYAHLRNLKYKCLGQLHDILLAENERFLEMEPSHA